MENAFGTPGMAAGYATARPPVHEEIVEQIAGICGRVRVAADIGCGSGVSTVALASLANTRIGLEPNAAMLAWARRRDPGARFVVSQAESMPLRSGSIQLATAAGSLNYTVLEDALKEAARVLEPSGTLVVYDFETGHTFAHGRGLEAWYGEFTRRYAASASDGWRPLDEATLRSASRSLALAVFSPFEIPIRMTPESYAAYMKTERTVTDDWVDGAVLEAFGGGARDVLFRGYVAYLHPRAIE